MVRSQKKEEKSVIQTTPIPQKEANCIQRVKLHALLFCTVNSAVAGRLE